MTRINHRSGSFRIFLILLLIVLIIASSLGWTTRAFGWMGLNQLRQSNDRYLQSAMNQSLTTFGVLSILKVGLAIVEGTSVGVGFNLQIGDAVQAVYDYVDLAWRVVLISATVLLGTRYILQTAELIDQWVLAFALLLLLLLVLLRWFKPNWKTLIRILRDLSLFFFIFSLSLFVLLPLSVTGGRLLSQYITAPSLEEAEEGLSIIQSELFPEGPPESPSVWQTIKNTSEKIAYISRILTQKASNLITWVVKLIAGYLFDSLIFPLLLFLFLFWFTRLVGRYLFGIQSQKTFREDLHQILHRLTMENTSQSPRKSDAPEIRG
ncbi:MAG TPA: hypothetical protein ENN03_04795 [bacterium]|nr:hypothetical protein [bacterium]